MLSVFGPYFLEENNQVEDYTHNNSSSGIAPGIRIEQSMNRGSVPGTDKTFSHVADPARLWRPTSPLPGLWVSGGGGARLGCNFSKPLISPMCYTCRIS